MVEEFLLGLRLVFLIGYLCVLVAGSLLFIAAGFKSPKGFKFHPVVYILGLIFWPVLWVIALALSPLIYLGLTLYLRRTRKRGNPRDQTLEA